MYGVETCKIAFPGDSSFLFVQIPDTLLQYVSFSHNTIRFVTDRQTDGQTYTTDKLQHHDNSRSCVTSTIGNE